MVRISEQMQIQIQAVGILDEILETSRKQKESNVEEIRQLNQPSKYWFINEYRRLKRSKIRHENTVLRKEIRRIKKALESFDAGDFSEAISIIEDQIQHNRQVASIYRSSGGSLFPGFPSLVGGLPERYEDTAQLLEELVEQLT